MSLAQEHRADLHKSGLTDETIAACGFESVRPHDIIKLKGVESAYRLPYFDLDGARNCFERLKLFPPILDENGHKRKYHQKTDTGNNLYLAPIVNWRAIAADVHETIIVTEGEKKTLLLCQRGKPTIGIGGTWNWRQKLGNGDRLVVPTLDQFNWKRRRVEIVPDSDCWRSEKLHALAGFYALGMVLVLRGADVVFILLPESGQGKVGVDDWLVSRKGDWANQWEMLERIRLDDRKLVGVAKWHQDWKAKQATQEAFHDRVADELTLTETAGVYTIRLAKHQLTLMFDRLTESRGGISAELTVTLGATELLFGVDVGLKSYSRQDNLAKSLRQVAESIPWLVIIQRACALVLRRHRTGQPTQLLTIHTPIEPLTYSVNPLLMRKKTSVIFADGGTGKSSVAVLSCMLVSTGGTVAGLRAILGKPLYLDYEDSHDVFVRRMRAIAACHPHLSRAQIAYQPVTEPLWTMVPHLLRRIQEDNITVVVVDSLLPATGGDSGAEATTKFFHALRLLNTDTLVIAHCPKPQADSPERTSVYGSVFGQNLPRGVWELKKDQEVDSHTSYLSLVNRKSNLSKLHPPIGLKVTQNDDNTELRYEEADLKAIPALERTLPLHNRIRNLLETDGTPRTAKQIAEALGEKNVRVVRTTLGREQYRTKWSVIEGGDELLYTALHSRNG